MDKLRVAAYCRVSTNHEEQESSLVMQISYYGKLIAEHNADPDAHPAILNQISTVDSRLSLLELMYNTDVSGNPFTVTFETLTGLVVSGVWNTTQKRIEF